MPTTLPELFLLLDANVLAGYYAPQTLNKSSEPAAPKIDIIIDSVRKGCSPNLRLLTPEICVAEAQTVLSKHANPTWRGVKKSDHPQRIHGKSYAGIVRQMHADLHGARLIESIPLQRYHVLAKHLITPIDHHLHLRKRDGTGCLSELGGTDQLICGLAICLARTLGQARVVVLTSDYRMAKVLEKAQKIRDNQASVWGLREFARDRIGFDWSREIYPGVLYMPKASESVLRRALGSWPLPTKKRSPRRPRPPTATELAGLVQRYKAIGIARDRLPYTEHMVRLTREFNDGTGLSLSEGEVWQSLIGRLKKGGGSIAELPPAGLEPA